MQSNGELTEEQRTEISDINALIPDLKMKIEDVHAWEQEELRKEKESKEERNTWLLLQNFYL